MCPPLNTHSHAVVVPCVLPILEHELVDNAGGQPGHGSEQQEQLPARLREEPAPGSGPPDKDLPAESGPLAGPSGISTPLESHPAGIHPQHALLDPALGVLLLCSLSTRKLSRMGWAKGNVTSCIETLLMQSSVTLGLGDFYISQRSVKRLNMGFGKRQICVVNTCIATLSWCGSCR